ncbi:MAG: hypothetical protein ABRQ25_18650 [Clostridiaceae bacterium]
MKVLCNDRDKLEKTHAYFGVELGNNIFEVYSIGEFKGEKCYLLKIGKGHLDWYKTELFKIIDDSIPYYWINKKFGLFSTLKNKKYDFSIKLKEYWGPEEFIIDKDFLFDIFEDFEKADKFAYEVIKKYQ